MKLIALGDNVIDYYHNTQECFPGGNAVNVAVHAARLGAQAEYLGSLGGDDMAHIVEKTLQKITYRAVITRFDRLAFPPIHAPPALIAKQLMTIASARMIPKTLFFAW
mgnify:CR=1 FL=1